MTMTDPIADMLTRIRNGQMAKKDEVVIPYSNFKFRIAEILKEEGYVTTVKRDKTVPGMFTIGLKYTDNKQPVITEIKRVSKPGHRNYKKATELPYILNDYGVSVVTTSKGLMTNKKARKMGLGGEVICSIY